MARKKKAAAVVELPHESAEAPVESAPAPVAEVVYTPQAKRLSGLDLTALLRQQRRVKRLAEKGY